MTDVEVRGRYFEDFEEGEVYKTPARTITAADITNFACLSGDFNDIHTNYEASKKTEFGQVVAHGTLVLAVVGGLWYASGLTQGTVVAMLQVDNLRMLKPTFAGDTIHVEATVLAKRPTSDGKRGIVTFLRRTVNQRAEVVQEHELKLMFRRREIEVTTAKDQAE